MGRRCYSIAPYQSLGFTPNRKFRLASEFPVPCRVIVGNCSDLETNSFDNLLYIDVLEHIKDDREEIISAARRLRPGGHLITLSPAHPLLYSEFDAAIGHHRRYTRASILCLTPDTLKPVRVRYLDSVGLLASLANQLLLRESPVSPRSAFGIESSSRAPVCLTQ